MATARSALETVDERRRPRQSTFGALGAAMVERGRVPAEILYGAEAAAAETPAAEVSPAGPVAPVALRDHRDPEKKPWSEAEAAEERLRPRQSTFGSLGAGMVERGRVPAHVLSGAALSAEQVELLLQGYEIVPVPPALPRDGGDRQDGAGVVAAMPVDQADATAPVAVVVVESEGDAEGVPSTAAVEPIIADPAAAMANANGDLAPDGEQPAEDGDDPASATDLLQPADGDVDGEPESFQELVAPEPAPATVADPTALAAPWQNEPAAAIATAFPPAAHAASTPLAALHRKPSAITSAAAWAAAVFLATISVCSLWRVPEPPATAAPEPAPVIAIQVAGATTPDPLPAATIVLPAAMIDPAEEAASAPSAAEAALEVAAVSLPVVVREPPAPAVVAVEPTQVVVSEAPVAPARSEQAIALVRRGDESLWSGDITTARLFYQRAANAGDPPAMVALAQSYDPEVLRTLGARGVRPEPAQARHWYAKAAAAPARATPGGQR